MHVPARCHDVRASTRPRIGMRRRPSEDAGGARPESRAKGLTARRTAGISVARGARDDEANAGQSRRFAMPEAAAGRSTRASFFMAVLLSGWDRKGPCHGGDFSKVRDSAMARCARSTRGWDQRFTRVEGCVVAGAGTACRADRGRHGRGLRHDDRLRQMSGRARRASMGRRSDARSRTASGRGRHAAFGRRTQRRRSPIDVALHRAQSLPVPLDPADRASAA